MIDKARAWLALAGAAATGAAAVLGLSGTSASAEPALPLPPVPVTVTQTATAVPAQPGAVPVGRPQTTPLAVAGPGQPGAQALAAAPAAATPTPVAAASGTLDDYFKSKGVTLVPQKAQAFRALSITLPMPPGWSQVPDPNVPDAFLVIANRNSADLYTPNAQLVVYKLVGNFDPNEAISHGFIDSRQLMAWQTTNATLADFGGCPSSLIEGTYRSNDSTLNTSRRHVIATVGPDRYLVSLSVTTSVAEAVADAPATDGIVNGFRVTAPTPAATPQ